MYWEGKNIRKQGFTIIEQLAVVFLSFMLIDVSIFIVINIMQTTKNNINNMDDISTIANSISFINYECYRSEQNAVINNFSFNKYKIHSGLKINFKDKDGIKISVIYGKIEGKLYRMKINTIYSSNEYSGELNPIWDKSIAGYFDIVSENNNIYFKILFKNINIMYYICRS